MFDIAKLKIAFKNLIGWRPHFDNCISINESNRTSESGDFYQDKHPALRLDYIKASLTNKQDLDKYLAEKVEVAIVNLFNDLIQKRQLDNYGKTLLEQSQLLNRPSFISDKIVNQDRLVALKIYVKDATGLQVVINQIGLQLDGAQTLDIYLFHTSKEDPIKTIQLTTANSSQVWKQIDAKLNSMESEEFFGGTFLLAYYQEDLTHQAINYSNFDWRNGECDGCGTSYYGVWKSIQSYFHIYPVYWADGNWGVKGKLPDIKLATYDHTTSFGLNLKLSVNCDLTYFFIQNKIVFLKLLGYQVALLILKDMQFSTEINWVKEGMYNNVVRELEGDKETNALNLPQRYSNELKAVKFNVSGINKVCLGCKDDYTAPVFTQV